MYLPSLVALAQGLGARGDGISDRIAPSFSLTPHALDAVQRILAGHYGVTAEVAVVGPLGVRSDYLSVPRATRVRKGEGYERSCSHNLATGRWPKATPTWPGCFHELVA